ncbi:MAG: hypothetical protein FJ245_15420 [Nitrospira sp.]|nr:hypothetical protein [Nitrospira sp.]
MGTAAAIVGAGVIGAGAGLGGAFMQSNAAAAAGRAQDRQFNAAMDAQERARLSGINQVAPFRSLGLNAIPSLFPYFMNPQYFALQRATNDLNSTIYTPEALTQQYGDLSDPNTFLRQGPHGGRGLFGELAADSNVPASVRKIANAYLREQDATTRRDEGSTSYGFNDPTSYAAQIKDALAQEATTRQATEQEISDLSASLGPALPTIPAVPQSLLDVLRSDNPAFARYRALLDTPTERFSTDRFTPQPYQETPEFLAKKALGEKYANRDLAARGLFSSGRATEVLNDFVTRLMAEDSDRQFGRQLETYRTNFNRDLTSYGLNTEAADRDILRAETGVTADRAREMSLYDLSLGDYGRRFNESQTRYANLFGLTNLGANAATQSANVNLAAGTNAANLAVAQGQAQANSLYRTAQPYADAVSSIGRGAVTAGTLYGLGAFRSDGGGGGYNFSDLNKAYPGMKFTLEEWQAANRAGAGSTY